MNLPQLFYWFLKGLDELDQCNIWRGKKQFLETFGPDTLYKQNIHTHPWTHAYSHISFCDRSSPPPLVYELYPLD